MPSKQGEKSAINLFWPSHTHTHICKYAHVNRCIENMRSPSVVPPPRHHHPIVDGIANIWSRPAWNAPTTKVDKMLPLVSVAAPARLCVCAHLK